MKLTLKEASEQTGRSKQAIQQSIKKGKISAVKDSNGDWYIEPVELFRVYPPINQVDTNKLTQVDDALQLPLHLKIKELEINCRSLSKKIDFYEMQIDELKEEKNHWRNQAQKLLITSDKPVKSSLNYLVLLSLVLVILIAVIVSVLFKVQI
jgi:hypothetical protein